MGKPEIETLALAEWSGGSWHGSPPAKVKGVAHDTRQISSGMLFVAIQGENHDGHDFLAEAFASGAVAAMVSTMPDPLPGPCLLVDDTIAAMGRIAKGWRSQSGALFIAVTGSAGKTTVKDMLVHLLSVKYPTVGTSGNWNNIIGLPLCILTTPADCQYGVFEVGTNNPGELRALCEILQPQWGVVTVVGAAHLENFGELSAIAREKGEVLRCLPDNGKAFINADCEYAATCAKAVIAPIITVSINDKEADYTAIADLDDGSIQVNDPLCPGKRVSVPYSGPREVAHMRNVLLAVAVAREAGVSWDDVVERMKIFVQSAMRWQKSVAGRWTLINDAYNANPLSMSAALKALPAEFAVDHTWLVLGDMLELGSFEESAHRDIGRSLADGNWRGLLAVGRRARWIAEEAVVNGYTGENVACFEKAEEAAEFLVKRLRTDDIVFLKASRGIKLEKIEEHMRLAAGTQEALQSN